MNDKQLDYFMAIAEAGSFRRASETLHVAQPALTRQMKALENGFGVELFMRGSKGVALTSAGELLLERARFLRRHRDQTRADVAAKGTVPTGSIGFGAPPSVAEILFQPLAVSYLGKYGNVKLNFFEGVGHLHQWLMSGEIDLAILPNSRLLETGDYSTMEFVAEPIYLVGTSYAFVSGSDIPPEEAIRLPLILTAPPSTVRRLIDDLAYRIGYQPHILAETESAVIQKKLVMAGLGYAILPHSAAHEDYVQRKISICRIRGWKLQRILAWRADRPLTAAVSRMIEHTVDVMQRLQAGGAFGDK